MFMWVYLIGVLCATTAVEVAATLNEGAFTTNQTCASFPIEELNALGALYNSTNGKRWIWKTNTQQFGIPWDFSTPNPNPCTANWQGISCSSCSVTKLTLSYKGMEGILPDISGLYNLTDLVLNNNYGLFGSIPSSLSRLAHLKSMILSHCSFNGTIPTSFGQLRNLKELNLEYNVLTGKIPRELTDISGLQSLDVRFNKLNGTLPTKINLWPTLYQFGGGGGNNFTGTVPSEYCNITTLRVLDASFFSTQYGLGQELPTARRRMDEVLDSVDEVNINDLIYVGQTKQRHIVHNNEIELQLINLFPSSQFNILMDLYYSTNGMNWLWELPYKVYGRPWNFSNPNVNPCVLQWQGLNCNSYPAENGSAIMYEVVGIYLSEYGLIGTLPSSLGSLTTLQSLYLYTNGLSGTIPSTLGNLMSLQYLSLEDNMFHGTIPSSLFTNTSNLVYLLLNENYFTGSLSEALSQLTMLQSLSISHNAIVGTIPSGLFTLPTLQYFAASNNILEGSIPSLPSYSSLVYIFLPFNQLTGPIPPSLTIHSNFSSLILSYNFLTGTIPRNIGDMTQLVELGLQYNDLYGDIPEGICSYQYIYNISVGVVSPIFPTSQPSSAPSLIPSSHPTYQPTASPTQPTSVPSSQPSSAPSASPTALLRCPAGHYLVQAPHSQVCILCPEGYAAAFGANVCSICQAGYYAPTNASECLACPLNFYQPQDASQNCIPCASGYITGATASTLQSQCVNPTSSFIAGFIFAGISIVVMWAYLYRGRLLRLALTRKVRLVNKLVIIAGATSKFADLVVIVNNVVQFILKENSTKAWFTKDQWELIKVVLFFVLAAIMMFALIITTIVFGMAQVLFNVMVLYRSYKFYIPKSLSLLEIMNTIVDSVSSILQLEFIRYIAYPFIYISNAIFSINVSLNAVQVSCEGAQSPGLLLINLLIVGVVIIIIRSDIQVYWEVAQRQALSKSLFLPFSNYYAGKNQASTIMNALVAMLIFALPTPCKVIQYCMSLVTINTFFAQDGRSVSNSNCDAVFSFPFDSFLAVVTTFLVYVVLTPVIYMLAQVIVPSFKLYTHYYSLGSIIKVYMRQCWEWSRAHVQQADERTKSNNVEMSVIFVMEKNREVSTADATVVQHVLEEESVISQTMENNHEDTKDSISRWIGKFISKLTRVLSILLSIDWLFLKTISRFLQFLFDIYRTFLRQDHFQSLSKEMDITPYNLDNEKLQTVRIEANFAKLPILPWFLALSDDILSTSEQEQERENIAKEWKRENARCPNFVITAVIVRKELHTMIEQGFKRIPDDSIFINSIVYAVRSVLKIIVYPASYFIIFQLLTETGRAIWGRVAQNYLSIFVLSVGCWMDFMVEEFDITEGYDRFQALQQSVEKQMEQEGERHSISMRLSALEDGNQSNRKSAVVFKDSLKEESSNIEKLSEKEETNQDQENDEDDNKPEKIEGNGKVEENKVRLSQIKPHRARFQKKGAALEKVRDDPKIRFGEYIAAVVKVRVVLLQIISAFTIWSLIAVDLAGCPILVFSENLHNKIPPLLVHDAYKIAEQLLREDAELEGREFSEQWKIGALGTYIFFMRSRLIQFGFILINTILSLVIVFDQTTSSLYSTAIILVVEFFIAGFAYGLYLLLLLHRYMFPFQEQQVEEPQVTTENSHDLAKEQSEVDSSSNPLHTEEN